MAADSGSALFRKLLGRQLQLAREQAGATQADAGDRIGRYDSTISRVEKGGSLIDLSQLEILCSYYRLDDEMFQHLKMLRSIARNRPWWRHLGIRPEATEAMLALEDIAHRIRGFDLNVVPGLLQTPAYARAVNEAADLDVVPEHIDSGVQLRMERQKKAWSEDRKLEGHFIIDEGILRRLPGNESTRRAQISRLLDPPESATIYLLPFEAGPHASMATYAIFDLALDRNMGVKGVHVEGAAAMQGVIAEEETDVRRYELVWERTRAKALDPDQTKEKLETMIRSINDE